QIGARSEQHFDLRLGACPQFEDAAYQSIVLDVPANCVRSAAPEVEQQISFAATIDPGLVGSHPREHGMDDFVGFSLAQVYHAAVVEGHIRCPVDIVNRAEPPIGQQREVTLGIGAAAEVLAQTLAIAAEVSTVAQRPETLEEPASCFTTGRV